MLSKTKSKSIFFKFFSSYHWFSSINSESIQTHYLDITAPPPKRLDKDRLDNLPGSMPSIIHLLPTLPATITTPFSSFTFDIGISNPLWENCRNLNQIDSCWYYAGHSLPVNDLSYTVFSSPCFDTRYEIKRTPEIFETSRYRKFHCVGWAGDFLVHHVILEFPQLHE